MRKIDQIRTERLELRRIANEDVETISLLYCDPDVMAMLGGVFSATEARVQAEALLQDWAAHGFGSWIARDANSNGFVGIGGLRQVHIGQVAEIYLGYMLIREFWGKGLATELAQLSTQVGFSVFEFPSIVSSTSRTNLRSLRVMEKVGFSFDRDLGDQRGGSEVLYRLTRNTWSRLMNAATKADTRST